MAEAIVKEIHQDKGIKQITQKMMLSNLQGYTIIDKDDISYLKSDGNYCEVKLMDGRSILCSKTLKALSQKLPHTCIRVHNSYVLNLRHVEHVDASLNLATTKNGQQIPISRSNRPMLKQVLNKLFD